MRRKPKFKPELTRIKLNPEQAVLACYCSTVGRVYDGVTYNSFADYCFTAFGKFAPAGTGPWTFTSSTS